ncbi:MULTISPECIES: peroxiredoxin family protein [Flavobacterium]|uniref:peroxiredoxin family protein n=1 Tax=Flavobacterium TaxID=237 RepID=UPI002114AF46|nr:MULTISPECIES: redoxin domain-containing protein [Flavobacterium]UUF14472.1 redoxin domain-containing protein [Flavobacterium panici]
MKKTRAMVVLLGLLSAALQAQTINVHFSHYAGKQYIYMLEKGSKKDTIATGKLDTEGKTVLTIPAAKKGYAGISHFALTDGGGMDFIVNNENFTISCLEEQPNFENTKYTGSPENDFLNQKIKQQKAILDKVGFVQYGLNLYKKEEPIHAAFQKENENLQQQFTALRNETAKSTLYAARFIEIYRFLMGIGSSFNQTEEEKAKELNLFVKEKLDMQALYNSGFWNETIEGWADLQQKVIKDDAILLADTKQILSRIKSKEIYTAFTEKIVTVFTKEGKDDLVTAISEYAAKSGKLEKPSKKLTNTINAPVVGAKAPVLETPSGKKTVNKKTLLFFYESGCNNCENEIHQLLGNYQIVKDKGYEVISIAADMTKNTGDGHDHAFPWAAQLCDYKGFAGPNFQTYAIIGTPTFFTIDEKGIITGKYARLIDTGILN